MEKVTQLHCLLGLRQGNAFLRVHFSSVLGLFTSECTCLFDTNSCVV